MSKPKSLRDAAIEAMSGDTKRDVWEVAGFPENVTFEALYRMYKRSGLGNAVVTRPVDRCWSTPPKIYDCKADGEPVDNDTPFRRDVKYLEDKVDLITALAELDEYQRVGRYAGLVIVAREDKKVPPVEQLKLRGVQAIVGLRPCLEGDLEATKPDEDFSSPNFGNPITWMYKPNFMLSKTQPTLLSTTFEVHHSRVFVFSENSTGNSVYGISPLEVVFNGLSSATKTLVAGSEGLFKNAKQPININVMDKDMAQMVMNNPTMKKNLDQDIKDFSDSYNRELLTWGADVKTLNSTMIDPANTFDMAVREVSAGSKIPSTVLIANEIGQLASSENMTAWDDQCNSRRENKCTPMIKEFLQHLIKLSGLSRPTHGIRIVWDDLIAKSDSAKLDVATKMATVNQITFNGGGAEPVYSREEIREASGFEEESEELEGFIDDETT